MEIGNSKDIWFRNCVDLVISKFSKTDYAPFGITGVNVVKVIRIHNRLLQDRWEKQYELMVIKSKKRHVEYLLYGETLDCPNEFENIIEKGFPFLHGCINKSCPSPVPLSNSIGLADVRHLQVPTQKLNSLEDGLTRATRWLLVVKAFLGFSVQDLLEERLEAIKMVQTNPLVMHNSLLRNSPISPDLTSLICSDNHSTATIPVIGETATVSNVNYTCPWEVRLTNDMNYLIWSKGNKGQGFNSQAVCMDKNWFDTLEEAHLESQKLKKMERIGSILPSLRRLYLSNNEISVIEGLENCSLLEELLLDNNYIREANGLPQLHALWRLDISHNCLSVCTSFSGLQSLTQLSIERNKVHSLKGLEGLQCLMELYAAQNDIHDLREIIYLRALPRLMVLDLSGNPVCQSSSYRSYSIYIMRKLKVLDLSSKSLRNCGDVFETGDFQELLELNVNNNLLSSIQAFRKLPKLVCLRIENNKIDNGPLLDYSNTFSHRACSCVKVLTEHLCVEVGHSSAEYSTEVSGSQTGLHSVSDFYLGSNMIESIASLHLSAAFSNLKLLSLRQNRITKVDGLAGLKFLEVLFLDNNNIKEFEPHCFAGLGCLKRLHMSNNALHTLGSLEHLRSLEKLDLASNFLCSNRLGGLSSLEGLAGLSNLSDLTLTNNPISRQPHYRVGIVGRLLQLRNLDGKEVAEVERAEAKYLCGSNAFPMPSLSSCRDPNNLFDNSSCASTTCGKVPIKVTSLNFEEIFNPSPIIGKILPRCNQS